MFVICLYILSPLPQRHTKYHVGLEETDTHVQFFWNALESFSQVLVYVHVHVYTFVPTLDEEGEWLGVNDVEQVVCVCVCVCVFAHLVHNVLHFIPSQEELRKFIKFACNQERIPFGHPCRDGGKDSTMNIPPYPMKIAPPDGSGEHLTSHE